MKYEDKVLVCFGEACEENEKKDGKHSASAADTTRKMKEKGWLAPLDTVIDIADILKEHGIGR